MVNKALPWATIGLWALTVIVAVVGGAVVIWGKNGALSFDEYVKALAAFALAHGILGVGRGINSGLTNHAAIQGALNDEQLLTDMPTSPGAKTTRAGSA